MQLTVLADTGPKTFDLDIAGEVQATLVVSKCAWCQSSFVQVVGCKTANKTAMIPSWDEPAEFNFGETTAIRGVSDAYTALHSRCPKGYIEARRISFLTRNSQEFLRLLADITSRRAVQASRNADA